MPQHAILRFAKHKAGPAGALEAHHERTKEKYARKPSINKQMEAAKLKQENEQLRRFVDNIPQEMMVELKTQQRQLPQKGRYDRD